MILKTQEASHARFITEKDLERERNAQLIEKLSEADPSVREEVLGLIGQAAPEVFIGKKHGHLRLVTDETQREFEKLLGHGIETFHVQTPTLLREESSDVQLPTQNQIDVQPEDMTQSEFEMYCIRNFSDAQARSHIISLFFREKGNYEANLKCNLKAIIAGVQEQEEGKKNVHNFGETEVIEPLKIRFKRWMKGERKRLFSYTYSFRKVQKQHKNKLGGLFLVRLGKTLLSHMGLRKNSVVSFTGEYDDPSLRKTTRQEKPVQLPHETKQMVEKVFVASAMQLSHLVENLQWYMGEEDEIYIPEEMQQQIERMKELETLGGYENLHEHIESLLACAIAYSYPELICKLDHINAAELREGIKLRDIALEVGVEAKKVNQTMTGETSDTPKSGISLQMRPDVAKHYGFKEDTRINCPAELLKHIYSLGDEEPVVFEIEGKKSVLNAKMFRRIFHRDSVPDKETETNQVIEFPGGKNT